MPHPSKFEQEDEHLKILATELKLTYKALYEAIQPIPYIRDKLYCVDKVFIEGGSEVCVGDGTSGGTETSWVRLESYKEIYANPPGKPVRLIIQADPGFGKTTQTLQYTFNWSTGVKGSPFADVQLLIYLRLRQLRGIGSLAVAVRRYLLPKTCQLKVADIRKILENTTSVAIILDGWDEYPEMYTELGHYMSDIISARASPHHDVILTTRYLPIQIPKTARRVRLTGFDDQARDQYIRRAVVGDKDEAVEQIKQRLKDNPVLADLCQVPLFFVMFAHLAHEKEEFKKFRSVTDYLSFMIKCFHDHLRNKEGDRNVNSQCREYEGLLQELSALAYEGLSKRNQQIVWEKEGVIRRLGEGFYEHYKRLGLLIEEEVITDQTTADGSYESTTDIRFYHKLFCEWYAAYHLAELAVTLDEAELSWELRKLDPYDLQYLYRFACGLNPAAGKKIIRYLQSNGGEKFAVLCILEQTGKVDDIKETIRKLCADTILIGVQDTKLLQRSTTQLLDIASSNKIPIACLHLNRCVSEAVTAGGNILLNPGRQVQRRSSPLERIGLQVPPSSTLQTIEFTGRSRDDISEEKMIGLLAYAEKCQQLKKMTFDRGYLLPLFVPPEQIPPSLKTRNIEVHYDRGNGLVCRLNQAEGRWVVLESHKARAVSVGLRHGGNRLEQEWNAQELRLASAAGIPIDRVSIESRSPVADQSGSSLTIRSQITLPILCTLQKLDIRAHDRRMSDEEVVGILRYSAKCSALTELEFNNLGCPKTLPDCLHEAGSALTILRSRNVKVHGGIRTEYTDMAQQVLDLRSGVWEFKDD